MLHFYTPATRVPSYALNGIVHRMRSRGGQCGQACGAPDVAQFGIGTCGPDDDGRQRRQSACSQKNRVHAQTIVDHSSIMLVYACLPDFCAFSGLR